MAVTPTDETTVTGAGPSLSIVVPAYNESRRIEECLRAVTAHSEHHLGHTEILIVDDGSSDDTLDRVRRFAGKRSDIRVLAEPHRGKAAAVRAGMLAATGRIVLFTDADLATPLRYTSALVEKIEAGADVVIASREGQNARRVDEPFHRHFMGRVFNLIVQALLLPGIQDTQCGFKAFRRDAAREILAETHLYRDAALAHGARVTAFDVELLYIARRLGQTIAVVPVVWSAGSDSKVNPVIDTWINLTDVLKIRLNGWRGRYPVSGR